jgi:hypothetical protein
MGSGKHMDYRRYAVKVFPPWLEQLTSITTRLKQPAFRAAERGLVSLLLLDTLETGIYQGGIWLIGY